MNFNTLMNMNIEKKILIVFFIVIVVMYIKLSSLENNSLSLLPVGSIIIWTKEEIPEGWIKCDGSEEANQVGAPNLSGRFVLGSGQANGLTLRVLGQQDGEEKVTLTEEQLPSHTHSYNQIGTKCTGGACPNAGTLGGGYSNNLYKTTTGIGGGQSHNNMPPYHVLIYIMKVH